MSNTPHQLFSISQKKTFRQILSIGLFMCLCSPAISALNQKQTDVLQAFFDNMGGTNWSNATGWQSATDPCTGWFGVICNASGTEVLELNLGNNNLVGQIPSSVGDLVSLQKLDVSFGHLDDTTIPPGIGQLTSLTRLYLNDSNISGPLPIELGQLTSLIELIADDNRLSGTVPSELGNLSNLIILRLYGNLFTGPIPDSLSQLTELKSLGLKRNALVGIIPSDLINMTKLDSISLDWNALHSDDSSLNTFINQRVENTNENYVDTQTIDASTRKTELELGESKIRLHWDQRNTNPETEGGYNIYMSSEENGEYQKIKSVAIKQSSSTLIENLSPSTTYYFKVKSYTNPHANHFLPFDLESSGDFYNPIEVTTLAAGSGNGNIDTTPDQNPNDGNGDGNSGGDGDPGDDGNGSADSSSGGSSGGCSLNQVQEFDPTLLLIIFLSILFLYRRRRALI